MSTLIPPGFKLPEGPISGPGGRLTDEWNRWFVAFMNYLQAATGIAELALMQGGSGGSVASGGAGPAVDLSPYPTAEGVGNLPARNDHRHQVRIQVEDTTVDLGMVQALDVQSPGLDIALEPNLTGSLLTGLLGYWPMTESAGYPRKRQLGSMMGADFLEAQGPTIPITLAGTVPTIAGHYNDLAAYSDPIAYSAFAPYQILQTDTFPVVDLSGGFTFACWVYLEPQTVNTAGTYSRAFEFRDIGGSGTRVQCANYPNNVLFRGVDPGDHWIRPQIVDVNGIFHTPDGLPTSDSATGCRFEYYEWHMVSMWMNADGTWGFQSDNDTPLFPAQTLNPSTDFPITIDTGYTFRGNFPLADSTWTAMNGAVQHMALWDRVLSADERALYWASTRASIAVNRAAIELLGV